MSSSSFSLGRLNNLMHNPNRGRFLSPTQWAIVAVFSLAVCSATNSQVSAQDPLNLPAIEDFRVDWVEEDPEANTWRFTFTGRIVNCELIPNPVIKMLGYPFDDFALPDSSGSFSVEIVASADIAFGRTIQAAIIQNGLEVSENAYTST